MQSPMPAPQGAAPEAPAAQGPGKASQVVAQIHDGMMQFMDMIEKKSPEQAQEFGQVIAAFQSFIEKATGGGQSAAPQPKGAPGVEAMEAGANPNARPM